MLISIHEQRTQCISLATSQFTSQEIVHRQTTWL